jgi:hypothetical protein
LLGLGFGSRLPFLATLLCACNTKYLYICTDVLNRVLHILLAIPSIHKNGWTLTISAKLTKVGDKKVADSGSSIQPSGRPTGSDAGSDTLSARRVLVNVAEPRQPVEDLV